MGLIASREAAASRTTATEKELAVSGFLDTTVQGRPLRPMTTPTSEGTESNSELVVLLDANGE